MENRPRKQEEEGQKRWEEIFKAIHPQFIAH